jgi:hypothetical protein
MMRGVAYSKLPISLETIGLTQQEQLEIAQEGVGDFAKGIWESIKALMRKFAKWIENLFSSELRITVTLKNVASKFEEYMQEIEGKEVAINDKVSKLSQRQTSPSQDPHITKVYNTAKSKLVGIEKTHASYLWSKDHANLTPWEQVKRSIEVCENVSNTISKTCVQVAGVYKAIDFSRKDLEYWKGLGSIKNDVDEDGQIAKHIHDMLKDYTPEQKGVFMQYVFAPPVGTHSSVVIVSSSQLSAQNRPHGKTQEGMMADLQAASNESNSVAVKLLTIPDLKHFEAFRKEFSQRSGDIVALKNKVVSDMNSLMGKIDSVKNPSEWGGEALTYVRRVVALFQFFFKCLDEDLLGMKAAVSLLHQALASAKFYHELAQTSSL